MTSAEADAEKAKQMKKVNDYEAGLQQFVKDTPEIGTYEKNEREAYLQDHYNVFQNDPGFQYVSDPKNFPEVLLANERMGMSAAEYSRMMKPGVGWKKGLDTMELSHGYNLIEQEQIRYIYNNLHTYKKVLHTSDDGFPQNPTDNVDETLNDPVEAAWNV